LYRFKAIAASHTDDEFTRNIFAMCESARRDAAPRVGYVLLGIAQGIRSNPPPNRSVEEREQVISFYTNFGQRLVSIPEPVRRG